MVEILFTIAIISWVVVFTSTQNNISSDEIETVAILMDGNITGFNFTSIIESKNKSVAHSFEEEVFYSPLVDFYFEIKMSDNNERVENYIIRNISDEVLFGDKRYHWQVGPYDLHQGNKTFCKYTISDSDRELSRVTFDNGTSPNFLIFECFPFDCCAFECCPKREPVSSIPLIALAALIGVPALFGAIWASSKLRSSFSL